MKHVALVTDPESLPIDFDMDLLTDACVAQGVQPEVVEWTDPSVPWGKYDAVLLRSPWSYTKHLKRFRDWCARVDAQTHLINPLAVISWGLDKTYLKDLEALDVPIVPTEILALNAKIGDRLQSFMEDHPECNELVIKPTVGAYSQNVGRFTRQNIETAIQHVEALFATGHSVIIQPYLTSIDERGETDMIFFDGHYSHAIRKAALLMPDGTVNVPSTDMRSARAASPAEREVGVSALKAVTKTFGLESPLLYARVDLVEDQNGAPVLLELEISEPSLSLPFAPGSPDRFAKAIANRLISNDFAGTDIQQSTQGVGSG
ncbi:hypothetical protein [uncultured Tateyamaria sp.]|uniref:ATP-grasp domain-containing protein n=1 Tax=uncultured Tateyamaria sp. TaxID=455651 RepID=UPI002605F3F7|nr:hypothetical protein [uncultured Tateyamaria sp.]